MNVSKKKHFIVLGAGISGLACAWYLKERFKDSCDVTVIEKSEKVGGCIQTIEHDGFLFELGPRSCRPFGAGVETLKLIQALGLTDQVVVGDSNAKKRYLLLDGKLQALPSSLSQLLLSSFIKDAGKAFVKDFLKQRNKEDDPSIHSFISHRFGQDIAELYIDAMTTGIYAGDIKKLSMTSCFPLLRELETKHRSVFLGLLKKKRIMPNDNFIKFVQKSSLFSFKSGMGTLTDALASQLEEGSILTSQSVIRIESHTDGMTVHLSDGQIIKGDYLFSALPAHVCAHFLGGEFQSIPYVPLAVVNVGYWSQVLNKKGFGYLVPSKENEKILGCVMDSSVFPEQNKKDQTRLTVMIGGAQMQDFHTYSDKDFERIALDALTRHLDVRENPDSLKVTVYNYCIPQYHVGHAKIVKNLETKIKTELPNMTFLGNSFYGVSVNDCISHAKKIVKNI